MIEHKNPNFQTDLHGDSASSLKSISTSILQFQISKITNVDLVRCKGIYTHTCRYEQRENEINSILLDSIDNNTIQNTWMHDTNACDISDF